MPREPEVRTGKPHTLTVENRQRAVINGVAELDSFNEEMISVYTNSGLLSIEGVDLHIDRLNLEEGQLIVSGGIIAAVYAEESEPKTGLFARLMRR